MVYGSSKTLTPNADSYYCHDHREILGIQKYPFDWEVTGRSIAYLFALSLPYSFLVIVFEYANDGGAGGLLGRALRAISYQWTKLMLAWHGIDMSAEGASNDYASLNDDKLSDDEDVVREREYVSKNSEELRHTAPVVLNNLWKIYPPSIGVFGATFLKIRRFLSAIISLIFHSKTIVASEEEDRKTSKPKQAVRGVHTAIKKGETYALLGANGM